MTLRVSFSASGVQWVTKSAHPMFLSVITVVNPFSAIGLPG